MFDWINMDRTFFGTRTKLANIHECVWIHRSSRCLTAALIEINVQFWKPRLNLFINTASMFPQSYTHKKSRASVFKNTIFWHFFPFCSSWTIFWTCCFSLYTLKLGVYSHILGRNAPMLYCPCFCFIFTVALWVLKVHKMHYYYYCKVVWRCRW